MTEFDDLDVETLESTVKDLTEQLTLAKKALREKRTVDLRMAMEAKKQADANVQIELRNLGYSAVGAYKFPTHLSMGKLFDI